MNKSDLVNKIAKETSSTRDEAGKFLEAFMSTVADSLKSGEDVRLIGFGTFTVVERKEKVGRNPRTGEHLTIPAMKQPKFRASRVLKEMFAGK